MISRSYFMVLLAITFLGPTTATSYSPWNRAHTSFDSKTNDQTKRRLKSEIPERISQLGGDSMSNSLTESVELNEDDGNINSAARRYKNERTDRDFHSRDQEYVYKDDPMRHVNGGHHPYKNNHYRKRMHGSYIDDVQMPFKTHGERLRRKLDDEKSNATLNSNNTQHNDTRVEMHGLGGEERVNGTKKPCIKSHPYKLISTPSSNVTKNNSDSNSEKTPDSKNNPTNHSVAIDHVEPNPKGTLANKNETKENSTTSMNGKDKSPKNSTSPDKEKSPKDSTSPDKEKSPKDSSSPDKEKSPKDSPSPGKKNTSKETGSGKSLMPKGQDKNKLGFGLPCNVLGQWVSEAGGVTLKIKASQNKINLDIDVLEQSSAKKGFLSSSWKINGNLPLMSSGNNDANDIGLGGPIVLTATILKDPSDNGVGKVAVFLGECRACYAGMESIVGTWSLKRLSKDCVDASLSQNEIRDVFHREMTSNAKDQAKSGESEATVPKDADQSKKPHSFWRRSYNKDGRHRRYLRNNPKYV